MKLEIRRGFVQHWLRCEGMFVLFGVLKLQSIYQFFGGPLTHPRRYCRDRDVFLKDHLGQDDGSEGQDTDHEEHASQV